MSDEHDDPPEMPEEVVLPLEDALDLHAFAPRDVRSVTEAYLEQALEAGLCEVRLIHGRGIGVQREIVRSLLERHPGVAEFSDAPAGRGGWGATVVRLRPGATHPGSIDEPRPLPDNDREGRDDGRSD